MGIEIRERLFQRLALSTTAATYLLILVGALVRATGSGLGCPDWPKCFGLWIPPTDVSQLPAGFDPAAFVVMQTWIEYLNRLLGAVIGLLILATVVAAFARHRHQPRIWAPSVLAFVLVLFEAWLGAKVVEHELASWAVTAHLVGAFFVVSLLLYATFSAFFPEVVRATERSSWRRRMEPVTLLVFALVLAQAGLGTYVRGAVEDKILAHPDLPRSEWLFPLMDIDIAHRQLALLTFFALTYLTRRAYVARQAYPWVWRATLAAFVLVSMQMLAGLGLAYLDMPAVLQVVHLSVGSLLFGALTLVWLFLRRVPEAIEPRRPT